MQGLLKPNKCLFELLSAVAFTILQYVGLDESTKTAISSVAAASSIQSMFPEYTPESIGKEMPPLFNELWEIHTNCGNNILPNAIAAIQDSDVAQTEVPEDLWIIFVRKLSSVAGTDFSPLLIKSRPIPLSVINSLHSFKQYLNNE